MFFMDPLLDPGDDDAAVISTTIVPAFPTTQSAVLSTLGAAVGDIAFVLSAGGAPNSDGAGTWVGVSNGSATLGSFYSKKLDAADVAGTIRPGATNIAWELMIVRGVNSVTSVRTASTTAGSGTAAGVTRDANHAGFVGLVTARAGGSQSLTGFVKAADVGSLSTYNASLFYRTSPPTTPYTSGASFAYDGGGAPDTYLVVAELRR